MPINLMAEIQRGDLRGTNTYEKGRLGTRTIVRTQEQGLDDWDARRFYNKEQIEAYVSDLVQGRIKYTEEIAAEGLRGEVLHAAERSYRIDISGKRTKVAVPGASDDTKATEESRSEFPREFKSRPRRDSFRRSR